jgi:cardiolipin synthase
VKAIVQPGAGIAPIIQAIRRARRTIDICIFRLDRKEIELALAAAILRGVRVRALVAHTNAGGEPALRKLEQRLLALGITVMRTADDLVKYHGKYMVADNTLYVLGFNFTRIDIDKSRSFAIEIRDQRTVREALKLFESDAGRQPYLPARSNLLVSPETAREALHKFIAGARRELAIYDVKIQDPAMIRALRERARKGVQIRVIGSLKGTIDTVTVQKPAGFRLHVRAIIRDGKRAIVGSMSLRKLELDQRREIGVLITSSTVTRQLLQVFESDWVVPVEATPQEITANEAPAKHTDESASAQTGPVLVQ